MPWCILKRHQTYHNSRGEPESGGTHLSYLGNGKCYKLLLLFILDEMVDRWLMTRHAMVCLRLCEFIYFLHYALLSLAHFLLKVFKAREKPGLALGGHLEVCHCLILLDYSLFLLKSRSEIIL